MSLVEAIKFLRVKNRDVYPVADLNIIVRLGKIPKAAADGGYWFPAWRISRRYSTDQIFAILRMLKKRFGRFAVAFVDDETYLILSDDVLDEGYANMILSKIMEPPKD
ncbi:hypothetical protein KEJ51_01940 [Candidatus Bathyarchaeota archaeon]|nr:hypothetical protein [Candidatus Bathyarchaeota archaeon]MBS7628407.1 hypothetical protein [Candidatus Bathyarchaeota archaeon]